MLSVIWDLNETFQLEAIQLNEQDIYLKPSRLQRYVIFILDFDQSKATSTLNLHDVHYFSCMTQVYIIFSKMTFQRWGQKIVSKYCIP